ncbi:hypothetical protein ACOMHN_063772 [Nucella lapillus]
MLQLDLLSAREHISSFCPYGSCHGHSASQTPGGNTSLQRPLGKKTEAEDIVCLCRPPGGALTDGLEAATHPCHHLGTPQGSDKRKVKWRRRGLLLSYTIRLHASQTPGGNTSLQRPLGKKTEAEDIVCLCRPPGGALTDGLEAATHPCHHLGPPRG